MAEKKLPFTKDQLNKIAEQYPTPFYIYDETAIRKNVREFYRAFNWAPGGFKNYFAVKALPNPFILKMLKEEGMGADCSSLPELVLAEKAGIKEADIMFTSNDTPASEYIKAKNLNAIINIDDISHIPFLEKHAGIPDTICFRYNPGRLKKGNKIIGSPEDAKYGLTKKQLFEGYRIMKDKGVKRFGIHTMVASNELKWDYFVETAEILFDLIIELSNDIDIHFDFINLGGGVGIPYRPNEKKVNMFKVSDEIKELYLNKIVASGLDPLNIFMECGRMVTGPYGYLVSRVIHIKETYKTFIGLDASMANLMRPAVYGAYHHISIPGKENAPLAHRVDITGSLCENNDKFAINRTLPDIQIGDLAVIHDTGAHGHSMGFNYNGKLRSCELLLKENGSVKQIRRAETIDDYFATLDVLNL